MLHWDFDDGPDGDDAWTWSCFDSDTGQVVRRSTQIFATLRECVFDAVKQRVDDLGDPSTHLREWTQKHPPSDTETTAMEEQLGELLEKALARRELLASLVRRAEAKGDKAQGADVEYRLAELDGAIALMTFGVTKH